MVSKVSRLRAVRSRRWVHEIAWPALFKWNIAPVIRCLFPLVLPTVTSNSAVLNLYCYFLTAHCLISMVMNFLPQAQSQSDVIGELYSWSHRVMYNSANHALIGSLHMSNHEVYFIYLWDFLHIGLEYKINTYHRL